MKLIKSIPIVLVLLIAVGCGAESTGGSETVSTNDPHVKQMMAWMEKKGEEGIFPEFIKAIGDNKLEEAYALLSEKLQAIWTEERFINETRILRTVIGDKWNPELVHTGFQMTMLGRVEQAVFRLEENYKSFYMVSGSAMQQKGKNKIVNLIITAPYTGDVPQEALSLSERFASILESENYEEIQTIASPNFKRYCNNLLLGQIRGIIVNKDTGKAEINTQTYRSLASGSWYDTIVLNRKNSTGNKITLYIYKFEDGWKIDSLDIKGRVDL